MKKRIRHPSFLCTTSLRLFTLLSINGVEGKSIQYFEKFRETNAFQIMEIRFFSCFDEKKQYGFNLEITEICSHTFLAQIS